jgi:juvenile hormone diol kinase
MLTDLQQKKLSRYFHVYDVDEDGKVGPADFARVIDNVRMLHGLNAQSAGFRELEDGYAKRWDTIHTSAVVDGDGGVDLSEWLRYWGDVLADEGRCEEEVTTMGARFFVLFDTDEDDVIGPDEFCNFFGVFGLSSALARQVFMDLDLDGDGVMSREEFLNLGRDFFIADDPAAPGNLLFGPYE